VSNYLTDARSALLAELKADPAIDAAVRTWFEFGPGLRRRYAVEPAACPLLALVPAGGEAVPAANALGDLVQRLRIEVATAGQDAAPCEELVATVVARLWDADPGALGLAAQGLWSVEPGRIEWRTAPEPSAAGVVWIAGVDAILRWKRT
jgi:hypothetical protein